MRNIQGLREELSNVFNGLKNGDLEPKIASEMNNAAGKIIGTLKIQLDYASLRREEPEINYLKRHRL